MAPNKIHVLMPVFSHVHPATEDALAELSAVWDLNLVQVFGHSDIVRARQDVATAAMSGEPIAPDDVVLWLDSDVVLDVATARTLFAAALLTHRACIALYVMRRDQSRWAAGPCDDEPITIEPFTLYPLAGAGLGCMAMSGRVFLRAMLSTLRNRDGRYLVAVPRVRFGVGGEPEYVAEDFSYCESVGGAFAVRHSQLGLLCAGHVVEVVARPDENADIVFRETAGTGT